MHLDDAAAFTDRDTHYQPLKSALPFCNKVEEPIWKMSGWSGDV